MGAHQSQGARGASCCDCPLNHISGTVDFWAQKIVPWISAAAQFPSQLITSGGVNRASFVCLQVWLQTWVIQSPPRLHQITLALHPHHLLSCLRLVALKTHYFSSSLNQGFRLFGLRRSEAGLPGIYLNTKKFRNQIMLFNRGSGIHHSPVASFTHSLLPLAPGFQSHQDETPPQCREDRGCNKNKILLPWVGFGGPPLQWWASRTEESSD